MWDTVEYGASGEVLAIIRDGEHVCSVWMNPPCNAGVAGTGTGFVINSDGYIVTNSHVVKGCHSVVTVKDSEKLTTRVIFDDSRNDLALLKVDKRPKVFATFRGGRSIRTAEDILALGYPFQSLLSDDLKITKGMVNSLAGLRNDTSMMQISAPVQPGNSGGPLLDHAGNVVGVVTSKMNAVKMAKHTGDVPQNINFALKASLVRDMLEVKSIDYETASSKKERKAVDIFYQARQYTVLIECREKSKNINSGVATSSGVTPNSTKPQASWCITNKRNSPRMFPVFPASFDYCRQNGGKLIKSKAEARRYRTLLEFSNRK